MALNMNGGPNWAKNFADSPIIIGDNGHEYYKQPMYYALAHFSRFIEPGSVRIAVKNNINALNVVAFRSQTNATIVILINRFHTSVPMQIFDQNHGIYEDIVPGHSIQTLIWYD